MNNRVDIKIAIVGDPKSGKETFCKMLFLDKANRIRLNPLSRLGEIYMEVDPDNFKHSTKNIIKECTDQNNLIMKQTHIANLEELRKKNIHPFFYRYSPRILGLVDEQESGRINRNILLTFYFIGNNYKDFNEEINMANIIIYLMDVNKKFDPNNELFVNMIELLKKSNGTKYMLPIGNKSDPLTVLEIETDNIFKEISKIHNIQSCLLLPVYISAKDATVFRMVYYKITTEIEPTHLEYISEIYGTKKEHIIKDICTNYGKYLITSGYEKFRTSFMKILNKNYRAMVDLNLCNELEKLDKYITDLLKPETEDFIIQFQKIHSKANRLSKIFKTDYDPIIIKYLKTLFKKIVQMETPNTKIIDFVQEIYRNNKEITDLAMTTKEYLQDKLFDSILNKNVNSPISAETFMPSNVSIIFEQLINTYPSKMQVDKLAKYICELYSTYSENLLLQCDQNIVHMLYNAFFTEKETMKIMSMLNEIKSMIEYDSYKNYLLKIFLAKLQIAEFIVYYKDEMPEKILESIVTYCKSLRLYISDNTHRKYDYLFINVADICSRIILQMDSISNAKYLSDNIISIINFKPDTINLDKFIIKMIKKTNYQAVIAEDDINSDDDSDVDIYGDDIDPDENNTSFNFTNAELATSDGEEYDAEPIKIVEDEELVVV